MNKIATYLNEHLLGEVSSAASLRKKYSTDSGILSITPEIVAFPRVTNDIRKIARFSWQLAEKGHIVGITARGLGNNTTSSAIGKGIIIDTSKYTNLILQIVPKEKIVHIEAGVRLDTLYQVVKWHGLEIDGLSNCGLVQPGTVGSAIATGEVGYGGSLASAVERLEVVLANGDVIETSRISRRDVNKKLGQQTFEGELYRKLAGLIEDNEELINQMSADETYDLTGYGNITKVRGRDGSFDLTPLFIGSQGTLGIISEVVLRTGFYFEESVMGAVTASSMQLARDIADRASELNPSELVIIDGELLRRAATQGVSFHALGDVSEVGAVMYFCFNDSSARAQNHKLKKLKKVLNKINVGIVDSTEYPEEDFLAIGALGSSLSLVSSTTDSASLPILNGASVPTSRREEFEQAVEALSAQHHVDLPHILDVIHGTYKFFPQISIDSVGNKQKIFKLMADFAVTVDKFGGAVASGSGEGRILANAAWANLTDEQAALYEQIRAIFDPFKTLNPGVKQKNEMRSLVAALRAGYDSSNML